MARKLYYKILDDGRNKIDDAQWEEILRLQHWYNSEFIWTAGKLSFKMYAVFPNYEQAIPNEDDFWKMIGKQRQRMRADGFSDNQVIHNLEENGYIIAKKGGYFDQCLASGFTRVAANEFNAYLVCEFLLKSSKIAPEVTITVIDEGEFIKTKCARFRNGEALVPLIEKSRIHYYDAVVAHHHLFSVVDAAKYDHFPRYKSTVADFNILPRNEQVKILRDWNWLGFESNFDLHGDDIQGFDLNKKVAKFELENY